MVTLRSEIGGGSGNGGGCVVVRACVRACVHVCVWTEGTAPLVRVQLPLKPVRVQHMCNMDARALVDSYLDLIMVQI